MATLKDVSEAAGVSMQAVSLVLNGKAEGQISRKNCEKILAAAEKLDFRINHNARRMRSKYSENLSVLVDDIGQPYGDYPDFRSNNTNRTLYGILDSAAKYGYDIKLLPMNSQQPDDLSYLDKRIGPPYSDGVIFHGLYYRKDVFELIRRRNLPYIVVSTHDKAQPSPRVLVAPEAAVRQAMKRLIEQGHRKIAWCGHRLPHESYLPLRFGGYESELRKAGIFDESLIFTADSELAIRKLAGAPELRRSFTAIFCSNDEIAYRWMLEFEYHGIRVPEDMAVIGFDGSYRYNHISTVNIKSYECGCIAAEELIKAIKDKRKPEDITVESIFEERGSN